MMMVQGFADRLARPGRRLRDVTVARRSPDPSSPRPVARLGCLQPHRPRCRRRRISSTASSTPASWCFSSPLGGGSTTRPSVCSLPPSAPVCRYSPASPAFSCSRRRRPSSSSRSLRPAQIPAFLASRVVADDRSGRGARAAHEVDDGGLRRSSHRARRSRGSRLRAQTVGAVEGSRSGCLRPLDRRAMVRRTLAAPRRLLLLRREGVAVRRRRTRMGSARLLPEAVLGHGRMALHVAGHRRAALPRVEARPPTRRVAARRAGPPVHLLVPDRHQGLASSSPGLPVSLARRRSDTPLEVRADLVAPWADRDRRGLRSRLRLPRGVGSRRGRSAARPGNPFHPPPAGNPPPDSREWGFGDLLQAGADDAGEAREPIVVRLIPGNLPFRANAFAFLAAERFPAMRIAQVPFYIPIDRQEHIHLGARQLLDGRYLLQREGDVNGNRTGLFHYARALDAYLARSPLAGELFPVVHTQRLPSGHRARVLRGGPSRCGAALADYLDWAHETDPDDPGIDGLVKQCAAGTGRLLAGARRAARTGRRRRCARRGARSLRCRVPAGALGAAPPGRGATRLGRPRRRRPHLRSPGHRLSLPLLAVARRRGVLARNREIGRWRDRSSNGRSQRRWTASRPTAGSPRYSPNSATTGRHRSRSASSSCCSTRRNSDRASTPPASACASGHTALAAGQRAEARYHFEAGLSNEPANRELQRQASRARPDRHLDRRGRPMTPRPRRASTSTPTAFALVVLLAAAGGCAGGDERAAFLLIDHLGQATGPDRDPPQVSFLQLGYDERRTLLQSPSVYRFGGVPSGRGTVFSTAPLPRSPRLELGGRRRRRRGALRSAGTEAGARLLSLRLECRTSQHGSSGTSAGSRSTAAPRRPPASSWRPPAVRRGTAATTGRPGQPEGARRATCRDANRSSRRADLDRHPTPRPSRHLQLRPSDDTPPRRAGRGLRGLRHRGGTVTLDHPVPRLDAHLDRTPGPRRDQPSRHPIPGTVALRSPARGGLDHCRLRRHLMAGCSVSPAATTTTTPRLLLPARSGGARSRPASALPAGFPRRAATSSCSGT